MATTCGMVPRDLQKVNNMKNRDMSSEAFSDASNNSVMTGSGLGVEHVEPWAEPVDGVALLEELRHVMKRYVVLPPMVAETLALWTVHTYGFELRNVSTYIGLGSPEKRCGKTTLLAVLNDRAADIWEPLLTVADLAGGEWPKVAREAALKLSGGAADNNAIGSLLLDILMGFTQLKVERIASRDLVGWLNRFNYRPWAEARKGRAIDELWLAQQLRPYGVRPKTIWLDGRTAKGYLEADFAEVWPRYVSRSDLDTLIGDRGAAEEGREGTNENAKTAITTG
jgi:hypothetical protein